MFNNVLIYNIMHWYKNIQQIHNFNLTPITYIKILIVKESRSKRQKTRQTRSMEGMNNYCKTVKDGMSGNCPLVYMLIDWRMLLKRCLFSRTFVRNSLPFFVEKKWLHSKRDVTNPKILITGTYSNIMNQLFFRAYFSIIFITIIPTMNNKSIYCE